MDFIMTFPFMNMTLVIFIYNNTQSLSDLTFLLIPLFFILKSHGIKLNKSSLIYREILRRAYIGKKLHLIKNQCMYSK